MAGKARYIMIGGFLGAGKTTAILKLAEHLSENGLKVGLITNDQSIGLVDTTILESHGFAVEEITGGCFCCRFNSLIDASNRLSEETRPDVFIAEPVGSCTDLKASVSYPLRRMYGDNFSIAPLSVLVDPIRAMRILGLEQGKAFSSKVIYVYTKQLEEAEQIVINKVDLVSPQQREMLFDALSKKFPRAAIFEISARLGTGLQPWFARVMKDDLGGDPTMDVDYDLYAEGEALLGWLNCTVQLISSEPVDGNLLIQKIAAGVAGQLESLGIQIAHLKMTLSPAGGDSDLAVLNVVRNDGAGELSHRLAGPIESGELIINLRAEANPELLRTSTLAALESLRKSNIVLAVEHLENFRPGKPQPTHRLTIA
ncbi:MAG TPA: GTP-binding protein [Tepidisphaeraceae bacterium]|nr:GTP-binding protein [Tepidisphaeraceae bacterium]